MTKDEIIELQDKYDAGLLDDDQIKEFGEYLEGEGFKDSTQEWLLETEEKEPIEVDSFSFQV